MMPAQPNLSSHWATHGNRATRQPGNREDVETRKNCPTKSSQNLPSHRSKLQAASGVDVTSGATRTELWGLQVDGLLVPRRHFFLPWFGIRLEDFGSESRLELPEKMRGLGNTVIYIHIFMHKWVMLFTYYSYMIVVTRTYINWYIHKAIDIQWYSFNFTCAYIHI